MKARRNATAPALNSRRNLEDIVHQRLSEKMMKKDVEALAEAVGNHGEILLKYSLHAETETANRASWVYRSWAETHTILLPSLFNQMISVLNQTENGSVIRNLTGVWVDHGYPSKQDSKILDLGFKVLKNTNYAIAVYANILGILAFPCSRYPELKEEIRLIALRQPLAGENGFRKRLTDLLNA